MEPSITIGVLLLVACGLALWLIDKHARLRTAEAEILRLEQDVNDAFVYNERMERDVADLFTKFAPLIEQTDWMTGRWGGRFNELVALENKRNQTVREARRIIMDSPVVSRLIDKDTVMKSVGADIAGIVP